MTNRRKAVEYRQEVKRDKAQIFSFRGLNLPLEHFVRQVDLNYRSIVPMPMKIHALNNVHITLQHFLKILLKDTVLNKYSYRAPTC